LVNRIAVERLLVQLAAEPAVGAVRDVDLLDGGASVVKESVPRPPSGEPEIILRITSLRDASSS
ncbi:MAG: hypothetical protein AAGC97_00680, partial [Planctomycetota bacterium]